MIKNKQTEIQWGIIRIKIWWVGLILTQLILTRFQPPALQGSEWLHHLLLDEEQILQSVLPEEELLWGKWLQPVHNRLGRVLLQELRDKLRPFYDCPITGVEQLHVWHLPVRRAEQLWACQSDLSSQVDITAESSIVAAPPARLPCAVKPLRVSIKILQTASVFIRGCLFCDSHLSPHPDLLSCVSLLCDCLLTSVLGLSVRLCTLSWAFQHFSWCCWFLYLRWLT